MSGRLSFGYGDGLVPELRAAWGARLIVNQSGMVDLLWDRQDTFGEDTNVKAWLNGGALKECIENIRRLLIEGTLSGREERPFVLHSDRTGAIVGNTNASAGYLYIAAWMFDDLPDGHPTRGFERIDALCAEHNAREATT